MTKTDIVIPLNRHRQINLEMSKRCIYLITPTYSRPTQKADLTRMAQTLMLVPNIVWVVVEDAEDITQLVGRLLLSKDVPFVHLSAKTPSSKKPKIYHAYESHARGVEQRNMGLKWIRERAQTSQLIRNGVLYFADDDNTYDIQLFEEVHSSL